MTQYNKVLLNKHFQQLKVTNINTPLLSDKIIYTTENLFKM